jgi:SOS-response transcriptional repressor LexA
MPRKRLPDKEKVVNVSANVLPEVEAYVEALAGKREWSKAKTAGKLIVKGIAAFERDGTLDDNPNKANVVPMVRKIGYAKAGLPIQAEPLDEWVEVAPSQIAAARSPFAVGVIGDSMIEDDIRDGDTLLLDESAMDFAIGRIVLIETPEGPVVKRFYRKGNMAWLVSSNPAYEDQVWAINSVRVVGVMIGCFRTYAAEALPEQTVIPQKVARYGKRA